MFNGQVLIMDREYREITNDCVAGILPNTYFISEDGRVYSTLTKRFKHPTVANTNYDVMSFRTVDGKSRAQLIHRILMLTYSDTRPEGMDCVNHEDGNKLHNSMSNMEWATLAGNNEHAQENGLLCTGEDCSWSKLTESQVREICQHLVDNDYGSISNLARLYNVHPMTINDIARRVTWKEISGDYDFQYEVRGHFTEEQVRFICETFVHYKDQEFNFCYYYIVFYLGLQDSRNVRTRIWKIYKKDPTSFAYITSQYDY